MLREVEQRLRVADRMAACIEDPRAPDQITHSLADIIRFRLLMIAAGYEDGNDASNLRDDPMFKIALKRTDREAETALGRSRHQQIAAPSSWQSGSPMSDCPVRRLDTLSGAVAEESSGMRGHEGHAMMGQDGMMGCGMMRRGGMMGGGGMMGHGAAMRVLFALMDNRGDGTAIFRQR